LSWLFPSLVIVDILIGAEQTSLKFKQERSNNLWTLFEIENRIYFWVPRSPPKGTGRSFDSKDLSNFEETPNKFTFEIENILAAEVFRGMQKCGLVVLFRRKVLALSHTLTLTHSSSLAHSDRNKHLRKAVAGNPNWSGRLVHFTSSLRCLVL